MKSNNNLWTFSSDRIENDVANDTICY